jgi:cyanophycinase-like exopeptidase
MIYRFLIPALLFCSTLAVGQTADFRSYFTGDTSDAVVTGEGGGLVLMGGNTENDPAMRWFLEKCRGGDVVVLRATGTDGYNDYLYKELGIPINSVQTIVTLNAPGANNAYVARQIRRAEGIWIAGGDQANYVRWWKDSPTGDALRWLIEEKKAVLGGTSAGMAVLGEIYFSALNGTITSAEALANPYNDKMTIGGGDFLRIPLLAKVITDTHYDARDRAGRHVAWMARAMKDFNLAPIGIASEEFTAVCIDTTGYARVFGGYPQQQDFAWFLRANCENAFMGPEICEAGKPLHWMRNKAAVRAVKIAGTPEGKEGIDLRTWAATPQAVWENWWVEQGLFRKAPAVGPLPCLTDVTKDARHETTTWSFHGAHLNISIPDTNLPAVVRIFDLHGRLLREWHSETTDNNWLLPDTVREGSYILSVNGKREKTSKIVVLKP